MSSQPHGIRNRVLAVFTLSLLFFGGALVYGISQLRAIGESLVVVDVGYLPLAGVAADLQAVVRQMDRDADRLAVNVPRPLEGHRANARFYQAAIEDGVTRARTVLEEAVTSTESVSQREALAKMSTQLDTIQGALGRYQTAYDAWVLADEEALGVPEKATQATGAKVEMDRRRKELGGEIVALAASVEGRIQVVSEQTVRAQNRALAVSGALALVASLMAGVLAAVALFALRPIGRLTEQVQRLAQGDYAGRVDVHGADEVGLLGREFNTMAEAVSERDRRLHERAEALDRLSLRLRQVIDSIRAGLVVLEGGRVATLNPAAGTLWSIAEGAPVPAWLEALPLGRHEAVPHDGRLFDVGVAPFGSGVLIVGDDVTERIGDRERLARSERLALVGQMLAQITHEVRNPLNAISLNAELLSEEIQDDEARAMLGILTGEIRRLEGLTARYLDLARRRQPELTTEDPLEVAREVAEFEREALRRAQVDLKVEGHTPGVGELDGEALRRVLRNVVRNAVEAGARTIRIVVGVDGPNVRVAVHDDGPGMDAVQVARIFEPFYTTKAKGTGLGLAISRQELEDVGGSLLCESAAGKGSVFRILLPVMWRRTEAQPAL